jgi:hypothetical protein
MSGTATTVHNAALAFIVAAFIAPATSRQLQGGCRGIAFDLWPENRGLRHAPRIAMRRTWLSQRCPPGSHVPPARRRINGLYSGGHRAVIQRHRRANITGDPSGDVLLDQPPRCAALREPTPREPA